VAGGYLLRPVVSAGHVVLWGGGVTENDSYAMHRDRPEPRSGTGAAQVEAESRSWWRRVFGG
jgi:hypothetical protein